MSGKKPIGGGEENDVLVAPEKKYKICPLFSYKHPSFTLSLSLSRHILPKISCPEKKDLGRNVRFGR